MGGGRRVVVVLVLTSLITFVTAPLFTTGHHNAWILCLIVGFFFFTLDALPWGSPPLRQPSQGFLSPAGLQPWVFCMLIKYTMIYSDIYIMMQLLKYVHMLLLLSIDLNFCFECSHICRFIENFIFKFINVNLWHNIQTELAGKQD